MLRDCGQNAGPGKRHHCPKNTRGLFTLRTRKLTGKGNVLRSPPNFHGQLLSIYWLQNALLSHTVLSELSIIEVAESHDQINIWTTTPQTAKLESERIRMIRTSLWQMLNGKPVRRPAILDGVRGVLVKLVSQRFILPSRFPSALSFIAL